MSTALVASILCKCYVKTDNKTLCKIKIENLMLYDITETTGRTDKFS